MHAFGRFSMGAALLAALEGGCDPGDPRAEDTGEAADAVITPNGLSFNGLSFNGLSFNGLSFNGVTLLPLSIQGLILAGHAPASAKLVGSAIPGALIGAELPAMLSNGAALTLRLDAVTTAAGQPDLSLYTVSYQLVGSADRHPLCGLAADGTPIEAIPLAGTWDESAGTPTGGAHLDVPGTFTLACRGHALAKCVELGYAPWRSVTECRGPGDCHQLSLAPFHQACTRMLRADYCGDGTPTTRDGTLIDEWDDQGLESDDASSWALEGEWGQGGATCVLSTRWATVSDAGEGAPQFIQEHCPSRWRPQGCGAPSSPFFTATGFSTPLATRPLLRSRITNPNG